MAFLNRHETWIRRTGEALKLSGDILVPFKYVNQAHRKRFRPLTLFTGVETQT